MIHWASQANLFRGIRNLQDLSPIVDALNESVAVLGSIPHKNQHFPLSLSIAMGAFAIRDSPEMWLMDYCPISVKGLRERAEEVTTRCRNLLLERMIGLFTKVEDVARNLWLRQNRELCSRKFSFKGSCHLKDCPERHSMPSRDECK